ncbi:MAG: hypothetical protein HYZ92_00580 [Candidatus Omnitrophica bacterium]|nr:hypothetical protein [Candidatus Omnitrophota bacterium]
MKIAPEAFEARHGIGYTTIRSRSFGIESELTFFVPREEPCEVWLVRLTNRSARSRRLELYPYIEWLLGDYHQELRYRNIMNLYNRIWYEPSSQAILAKKTAFWASMGIRPFEGVAFFGSSLPVVDAVTHKEAFVGRYGSEESPEMLVSGRVRSVNLCSGEDGVGVLRHRVSLKPKQTLEFAVVMGQTDAGEPEAKRLLARYRDVANARAELAAVTRVWRARAIDNIRIETPDPQLNQFVNSWLKYEVYICNYWSRSPSYFHEGSGGRGYRDSCQDADAIALINPECARQKILKIAGLIRQDGTCAPGWSDISGPAGHRPNKDHPVWLTVTVADYIKETGDAAILREALPYLKDKWIKGWDADPAWNGGAVQDGSGSLFEHLERNLDFTFNDVGPHGIPRIGHADWNDALDSVGLKGNGETVWLGMALVRSLKIFAELALLMGEEPKATLALERAEQMSRRINEVAWDGEWYLYGFTDSGGPFGSKANREGKIYLNTQSWAILAGIADEPRKQKVLASVDKYLDGPYGLALFAPAYTQWEPTLGRISMFSEGTKENAAVFCHAATFMIVADLMAGRGTIAHARMRAIAPNTQPDYELYKTEPYAFAEYLVGPGNPYRYGEGAFHWLTGTSGWFLMAVTEWFLGARRDYQGLRIDPCLPKAWKRVRMVRPFRGATYEIEIRNPHGLEKGKVSVEAHTVRGIACALQRPSQGSRRAAAGWRGSVAACGGGDRGARRSRKLLARRGPPRAPGPLEVSTCRPQARRLAALPSPPRWRLGRSPHDSPPAARSVSTEQHLTECLTNRMSR